jgi:hypothetical protein
MVWLCTINGPRRLARVCDALPHDFQARLKLIDLCRDRVVSRSERHWHSIIREGADVTVCDGTFDANKYDAPRKAQRRNTVIITRFTSYISYT